MKALTAKRREAIALRRKGLSLRRIRTRLSVSLSSVSLWLRDIELTTAQKEKLRKDYEQALVRARTEASKWHRAQKETRILQAHTEAQEVLLKVDSTDSTILELSLAFLYLGEGGKTHNGLSLGNSNPRILKFFLSSLYRLYKITPHEVKCYLHLRADQDEKTCLEYWSATLNIPLERFGKSSFDSRTLGRPSYDTYKGVCSIHCSKVAIQRRLMYIADGFCDRVSK